MSLASEQFHQLLELGTGLPPEYSRQTVQGSHVSCSPQTAEVKDIEPRGLSTGRVSPIGTREKPLPMGGGKYGHEEHGGQQGLLIPETATTWLCILAPTLELCGGSRNQGSHFSYPEHQPGPSEVTLPPPSSPNCGLSGGGTRLLRGDCAPVLQIWGDQLPPGQAGLPRCRQGSQALTCLPVTHTGTNRRGGGTLGLAENVGGGCGWHRSRCCPQPAQQTEEKTDLV